MISRNLTQRFFSTKVFKNAFEALYDIKDGATVLVGGFGLPGVPENTVRALNKMGVKNLDYISNSMGIPDWGPGMMANDGQMSKISTSFLGGNPAIEAQYLAGKVEVEFVPQGSLSERIRSAQANIGAFYTPTGLGSIVELGGFPCLLNPDGSPKKYTKGRKKAIFDGKEYLLEEAFHPDYSFIKAHVGDKHGNLRYRKISKSFNAVMAGASRVTIAEVDYIVDRLPPEKIHTPGILVDRLYQCDYNSKKVERIKIDSNDDVVDSRKTLGTSVRDRISKRLAKEMESGMYVNLGIGIPSEIPPYIPPSVKAQFQVENGLIGVGPYPSPSDIDSDLINAAKETVTTLPGYSISDSAETFGMMRGKHLHMTILGGMQVSVKGDLANWYIPGKKATGMGGAMDLAASGAYVVVGMEHTSKGTPRILNKCTYPLTAKECVNRIVTEIAVLDVTREGLVLVEKDPAVSLEKLKEMTPADYTVSKDLKDYCV